VPTIDDQRELRRRVVAAPVARLATVRPDGSPRLVPITFALLGELLCFAVDEVKPKRDARLARLGDIARDPRVTLLVDHYDADWSALWWVRIDGTGRRARRRDAARTGARRARRQVPALPGRAPGRTGRDRHAPALERVVGPLTQPEHR
jgi:PPOX class probable F420-dependent enzyme